MINLFRSCITELAKRGIALVTLSALVLLLALPACYTILKHPTVLEEDYAEIPANRCDACHNQYDLWQFHNPRNPYYPGMGYYDPWIYYYEMPWWYESFWLYEGDNSPETVPIHRRSLLPKRPRDKTTIIEGGTIINPPLEKSRESSKDSKKEEEKGKDEKKKKKRSLKPKTKREKD